MVLKTSAWPWITSAGFIYCGSCPVHCVYFVFHEVWCWFDLDLQQNVQYIQHKIYKQNFRKKTSRSVQWWMFENTSDGAALCVPVRARVHAPVCGGPGGGRQRLHHHFLYTDNLWIIFDLTWTIHMAPTYIHVFPYLYIGSTACIVEELSKSEEHSWLC